MLEDIDRQQVDSIVCLGDVAATGPQPREAVDRVAALGCPVVRGNTDRFLLAPDDEDLGAGGDDLHRIIELDRWGAEQLEERHRTAMAGYAATVRHGDLLAFHGTPRSDTEQLRSTTPEAELAEMLAGHDAAVFAGGHTHAVMVRQLGRGARRQPGQRRAAGRDRAGRLVVESALGGVRDPRGHVLRAAARAGGRRADPGCSPLVRDAARRLVVPGLASGGVTVRPAAR